MENQFECIDPEKIIAISRFSTNVNKTGTWGSRRPVHQEKVSPCRTACPIGNNIPQAFSGILDKDFDVALRIFMEENPLPGVCGRVCYHFCQSECNRGKWDGEVSIQALERTASDLGDWAPRPLSSDGKDLPIAVVGSGPAGLSASYHLARMGHPVTLFEAETELGGMLRWGIPDYRLPNDALQRDIVRILSLGIRVQTDTRLKGQDILNLKKDYMALFLAFGAHKPVGLGISGEDSANVLYGAQFLKKVKKGEIKKLQGKILVIGGGNVALDAALSARKLGASEIELVCLETWDEMPAHANEREDCREEGIVFRNGYGPREFVKDNGNVRAVELVRCTSIYDEEGLFDPRYDESETFTLETDYVVSSTGQVPDLSPLEGLNIKIDEEIRLGIETETLETSIKGIYAGGDMVRSPGSVAEAIASGKLAAMSIHQSLREGHSLKGKERIVLGKGPSFSIHALFNMPQNWDPKSIVRFEDMEPLFLDNQPREELPRLQPDKRRNNFNEINLSLSKEEAYRAAGRCFFCGTCTGCDRCFIFCPDASIQHPEAEGNDYSVDSEHCKGCAVCEAVCPRGVMCMDELS